MKIVTYLINLDGSDHRLEQATQQLKAVNCTFERFSAVDGRGKSITEFPEYDDIETHRKLGRSLMPSELGCYLSHYRCVEKFIHQTDADYLVVLEDDMKIDDQFKTNLDYLLEYLDSHTELDWMLVNIAAKKKKFAKDIYHFNNMSLWHAYYFPIRGLGLVWNRKGANEFLKLGKTIYLPVDVFFQTWLSQNGQGLGVWPALVRPSGIDSDILGTVAEQKISRKQKENRSKSFEWKKQKRMWRDRMFALKHKYFSNIS